MKPLEPINGVRWGVHLSFLSPDLVEFVGTLGFHWLFLDAQRTPLNPMLCRDLVRAADVANLFCIVRVADVSAREIESYLDAGVLGIIAPNVSSAADARALVSAVKFSPEGTRGAAFRSRSARYGLTQSPAEYCAAANHTTFTAALIESKTGLDELESIAAVPGLDYLSIGANDLALSLGISAGAADARYSTRLTPESKHSTSRRSLSLAMPSKHEAPSLLERRSLQCRMLPCSPHPRALCFSRCAPNKHLNAVRVEWPQREE